MNIKIIAMGKITEKYHKVLIEQGVLKLKKADQRIQNIEIIHINEEKLPNAASETEIDKALEKEAESLLSKVKASDYLLCMDIQGKNIRGNVLDRIIDLMEKKNKKDIAFVIGSSYGLSENIKKRADYLFSLGKITLNHQVVPALLLDVLSG